MTIIHFSYGYPNKKPQFNLELYIIFNKILTRMQICVYTNMKQHLWTSIDISKFQKNKKKSI